MNEAINPEETLEKLDQEIILHLQKIDSNLNSCFNKITQDIIPEVRQYGAVCEKIMDSVNWLEVMFRQTGTVDLPHQPINENENDVKQTESSQLDSIFPNPASYPNVLVDSSIQLTSNNSNNHNDNNNDNNGGNNPNNNGYSIITNDHTQEYHTANITTTGPILRIPSSDDENGRETKGGDESEEYDDYSEEEERRGNRIRHIRKSKAEEESSIQRREKMRKSSMQLRQEFGSSSSVVPSTMNLSRKIRKIDMINQHEDDNRNDNDNDNESVSGRDSMNSSPFKSDPI